jgi:hypothetical protein
VSDAGLLTAEIRLWWRGDAPAAMARWFEALGPGEVEERTDSYVLTGNTGLGIKQRGGEAVEVKALVAELGSLPAGPPARLWLKQSAPDAGLPLGGEVHVAKSRRLAVKGECEIELGAARLEGAGWWSSLCFEAVASIEEATGELELAWSETGPPPGWESGWAASYPEWLARLAAA